MGTAGILSMFFGRSKPQSSSTSAFPLADAIMNFDDSSEGGISLAQRDMDDPKSTGRRSNAQRWALPPR